MKKLIRKAVLLTTIFSLCFGIRVLAAYNTEYQCENNLATIVSAVNQGQYTLLTDEYDEQGLVHTNQWNEYQLMLSQGSPKVVCVWTNGSSSGYYGIIAYQLEGQQKVTLPENAVIKVTDKYNLDHLSILKYVGNQLGSSQLFNVNAALEKEKQEIKKSQEKAAAEIAKQQAEAKADQQQIDLNNQINAELNVYSENKAGQKTSLKYSKDYLINYSKSNLQKSNDKIWASFDNERNYVQQWLTANGFKNLKELENIRYNWKTKEDEEKSAKYSSQSKAAQQYYKDVESGVLPQNCSMGEWIRYNLKKNPMGGWNGLAQWSTNVDFGLVPDASNTKWVTYQDSYNNNVEIKKMIEENLPVIASYANLTKEQKTQTVESLISGTFISPMGEKNSGIKTAAEFRQEILNKWNTEYLPSIKE